MKQPSSTAGRGRPSLGGPPRTVATHDADGVGRGRPKLGGPPRQPQSFYITDYQIAHLKALDPSGRSVMAAGFRALLEQSMARAAVQAQARTEAGRDV